MPKYLLNKLQKGNEKSVYFQLNAEQESTTKFKINDSFIHP